MQRLLSAKTERESRRALFASWVVIFFQFTLFLVIGTILYVDYRDKGLAAPKIAERIYPDFIWNNLPVGVAGLVMAAILAAAMSNLSAALNALASTTVMDFLKAWSRTVRPESHYLKLAKLATIAWGVVLVRDRLAGAPLGTGAGGRPFHRIGPLWSIAGRVFAGPADEAAGGTGRHDRHGGRIRWRPSPCEVMSRSRGSCWWVPRSPSRWVGRQGSGFPEARREPDLAAVTNA